MHMKHVQEQNKRLLEQLKEKKDGANIKLMSERIKFNSQQLLNEEKELVSISISIINYGLRQPGLLPDQIQNLIN